MDLKKVKSIIFLAILFGSLIIPTSAFASTYTGQSTSTTGISQVISDFFSVFNKTTSSGSVQNTTTNSSNFSSMESNDLFDCFWKWLCSGNNSGGKDDDGKCQKEDYNWGNDNGCLSSSDVWKEWYCKF
ncbi:hypothetical protein RCG17_19525 [Neobacillus sp. PS3-12]|uniref:hypothetical protein n=1 Tax=Neobacillus sp. PS3-12 TaxID=3070677 RepID=UPI0027DFA5EC|nr:hypothetical protein [Neobacillus sp. PS3-12]WML51611.1 hypothetical protein RCG17_19525 [Neobacillus sp. PS3-12]